MKRGLIKVIDMKIIAKAGTEFEGICKEYYEQMMEYRQKAFQLAEKYLGATPTGVGYIWVFGHSCKFDYTLLAFPKDAKLPVWFKQAWDEEGNTCYKLNRKYNAACEFSSTWENEIKPLYGEKLIQCGIPVFHNKTRIYTWWQPFYEDGRYGIIAPSTLLDRMDKQDNPPFEIDIN